MLIKGTKRPNSKTTFPRLHLSILVVQKDPDFVRMQVQADVGGRFVTKGIFTPGEKKKKTKG